jgi:hypothetical protein
MVLHSALIAKHVPGVTVDTSELPLKHAPPLRMLSQRAHGAALSTISSRAARVGAVSRDWCIGAPGAALRGV